MAFDMELLPYRAVVCYVSLSRLMPGYIPQYIEIEKTQNADGFSTGVSFILLVAHCIRVFFWYTSSATVFSIDQRTCLCLVLAGTTLHSHFTTHLHAGSRADGLTLPQLMIFPVRRYHVVEVTCVGHNVQFHLF